MSPTRAGLEFDLSGVGVRIVGLPGTLGRRLCSDWGPFVAARPERPFLEVVVESGERRVLTGAFAPKTMEADLAPRSARYALPEGSIEVHDTGSARARLHDVDEGRAFFAWMNLLRAALAWRLPARRGALVHAAGLVVDGCGFVLVGPEGSGKSTWARLGESVGNRVVSDDLVMLDGVAGRVEVLGAPFRSTHPTPGAPGRWPLGAVLLPSHGRAPRLDPVGGLEARAAILANLPFVATAVGADARVASVVDRLATEVPVLRLVFSPDPGFAALLRGLPGPTV